MQRWQERSLPHGVMEFRDVRRAIRAAQLSVQQAEQNLREAHEALRLAQQVEDDYHRLLLGAWQQAAQPTPTLRSGTLVDATNAGRPAPPAVHARAS
jgi:uncharacterized protein HemY